MRGGHHAGEARQGHERAVGRLLERDARVLARPFHVAGKDDRIRHIVLPDRFTITDVARPLCPVLTRPAAKAFRVRDGKEVKPTMLFRPDDNTWAGLIDVGFRVGPYGRLEFTHEGEQYAIQYMPIGMQRIEAPPAFMVAQMTYAGVDHCILQAGGGYGAMNDYNAFAQSEYPDKFTGLLHVDEAVADRDDVLAEIDRAHKVLGLKGLYYSHDFSRHGYARNLDHAAFAPFWDKIASFGLPVFVELSATPHYDRASYIGNLMAFDRVVERHGA